MEVGESADRTDSRSTYFTGAKYAWLIEHVPAVRKAKEEGRLLLGTVDSYLLYACPPLLTTPHPLQNDN